MMECGTMITSCFNPICTVVYVEDHQKKHDWVEVTLVCMM